jgi:phosphatidylglycerophosphatase A
VSGPSTSPPSASRTTGDRIALLVATGCGLGYAPLAPGTVASAVTAAILWLVPFSRPGLLLLLVALTAAGIWAAHRAEALLGGKDPGAIVIDEVAGMTLSVLLVPLTPRVLAAGFVLFRLFDVLKPQPAQASQRITGGLGVVVDDLVAGLYALLVLVVLRALLGWP